MDTLTPDIQALNTTGLSEATGYTPVCSQTNLVGAVYPCDARTKDAARGMDLVLDRPALVGWNKGIDATFAENHPAYRAFYKNYGEMNNGQINYYVDRSISEPFFAPVYTLSSFTDKVTRVTPMDAHWPEYYKYPTTLTHNSVTRDQRTRDQLAFREDLMSRQQAGYNRTSWVNRNVKSM